MDQVDLDHKTTVVVVEEEVAVVVAEGP